METKIIRVLIADDHEIYRDGLKLLLRKNRELEIVAEAEDGAELVKLSRRLQPDVILTDIKMPLIDGIAATRQILEENAEISIIALSMFDEESLILDMIDAGAKGYLLKNADKKEIIEAIKTVHAGEPYYCKQANLKLSKMLRNFKLRGSEEPVVEMTEKELELIALICQEKTNKEIGELLFVSPRTVERYKLNIMEKMKAKSTLGIAVYAIRHGLYKDEKVSF